MIDIGIRIKGAYEAFSFPVTQGAATCLSFQRIQLHALVVGMVCFKYHPKYNQYLSITTMPPGKVKDESHSEKLEDRICTGEISARQKRDVREKSRSQVGSEGKEGQRMNRTSDVHVQT